MIETGPEATSGTARDLDEHLIRECVEGSESAWCTLVDKYRNLIFSIPIRYGFSREDAADVFQNVCVTLLSELPRIRDRKTLPAWLIQVTAHECFRLKRKNAVRLSMNLDAYGPNLATSDKLPDAVLEEIMREQILREVVLDSAPRCRELIQLLFFRVPPMPYETVAAEFGLATGSIGFIRMRCLERLRRDLEQRGF
jgi:RNA polymerase sigma factor (sigma-70 family)